MRIARTLSLYVMREALVYSALAFFVLTLVLLTQNLLRRLDQLFLVGMTMRDLRVVVECIFPVALSYSIPLAFLIGILLSVRRFSADGELRGLGSTGISPTAFLLPHIALGLIATGVSAWLLTSVEHESRRELVQLFKTAAARGAILEPGKFREIGRRVVFVEDRDRDGNLAGVMILDQSQTHRPYRIFADRGRFHFNEETAQIELELWNGDLHFAPTEGKPRRYERIYFEEFSYQLDVGHILRGNFGPVRPKQMNLAELRAVLSRAEAGDPLNELDQRNPLEYELEIHRRRTLPFAPLLFAGVAVPIALASEDRGRAVGMLLVLSAAFGYYALAGAMESLAEQPWLSAAFASWIPNILFAGLGLALTLFEQKRIPA
jgi:lipopolysaccharide export system permease protein